MPLRILAIGDIVGRAGMLVVAARLPVIVRDRGIDLVRALLAG